MTKLLTIFLLAFLPIISFSQSLISVSPNSGNAGQTLNVTITGANTHFDQGSGTTVNFEFGFNQGSGTTVVNYVNVTSPTVLIANITIPVHTYTGDYTVSTYNYIDGNSQKSAAFHVNGLVQPTLSSVSPNSANNGQTLDVTITGLNTHFDQGSSTSVNFDFGFNQGSGTTLVNSINVTSPTTLVANITVPTHTYTGDYTVSTYNDFDGYLEKASAFHVNGLVKPTLSSVSPNSANNGQTLDVTITGLNTHFDQGSSTSVNFDFGFNQGSGTTVVNSINVTSPTTLIANITVPVHTYTGDYTVSTYNEFDGSVEKYSAFHVNGLVQPTLSSVSPNSASNGQTLDVTITGLNTHFDQGSSTSVNFNFGFNQGSGTTVVNSINVTSPTTLTANITVPTHTLTGDYNVSIYNDFDGYLEKYSAFHVNGLAQPFLSSASPNSGNIGQTLDVTITGANTHFDQGSSTSVNFGFNQGSGTTVVNSVKVTNATTLVANITVPYNTLPGNYTINVVSDIDGSMQLYSGFHVNGSLSLTGHVVPKNISQSNLCDGSASVVIDGGTAPYTYLYSNGFNNASAYNLCEGLYSVSVSDANGHSLLFDFIITSPSNTTKTNHLSDSTLVDSLYNKAISNCVIDYSLISSVSISSYTILPNNQVAVTWEVIYGGKVSHVTDTYGFSSTAGVYLVALQLYCPTKSTGHYLTSYDKIYYNAAYAGIHEVKNSTLKIYPNPFTDHIIISLDNDESADVLITDITGKEVLNRKFNDKLIKIDMNTLSSGSYIVTVRNNNTVTTKQIVK